MGDQSNPLMVEYQRLINAVQEAEPESDKERDAVIEFISSLDIDVNQIQEVAVEILAQIGSRDPGGEMALLALKFARPLLYTIMFSVLIGYAGGRQCGE